MFYKQLSTQNNSSVIYRPIILKLNREEDRNEIEEILNNNESIQIYDTIENQITEFEKIINLGDKPGSGAIADFTARYIKVPKEVAGVWVYYPWSNKMVHLLDEDDFIKVRTNRNIYKITPSELEVLKKKD